MILITKINIGGFNIYPTCNYPEAYLEGTVNVSNIKFYYSSGKRLVNSLYYHFLRFTGSGSFLINGAYFEVYSTYSEQKNEIFYQMQSNCLPMIDTTHIINYNSTYTTLPFDNSLYDKYALIACQVYMDTYRRHKISFSMYLTFSLPKLSQSHQFANLIDYHKLLS